MKLDHRPTDHHTFGAKLAFLSRRSKDATSNKCHASSIRCLTTRNKKLLGAPGLTTSDKKLLGAKGIATNGAKDAVPEGSGGRGHRRRANRDLTVSKSHKRMSTGHRGRSHDLVSK